MSHLPSSTNTSTPTQVNAPPSTPPPSTSNEKNVEPAVKTLKSETKEECTRVAPVIKSCLKRSPPSPPLPLDTELQGKTLKCVSTDELCTSTSEPSAPLQKNRRRCFECRVKIGLAAVQCRCGYTFCPKHRYAEEHSCRFNFKSVGKRKLEIENPRVVPLKVQRIN